MKCLHVKLLELLINQKIKQGKELITIKPFLFVTFAIKFLIIENEPGSDGTKYVTRTSKTRIIDSGDFSCKK